LLKGDVMEMRSMRTSFCGLSVTAWSGVLEQLIVAHFWNQKFHYGAKPGLRKDTPYTEYEVSKKFNYIYARSIEH
jgi:hypothetical protein